MKNVLLATAVALTVTAVVTDAHATPDDDLAETTQRMAEGKALYDAKRYEEARRKNMQACAIMRTPRCLIALSLAEYRSGHYLEAYTHGQEALSMPNAPHLRPPISIDVKEALDGSYAKLGHYLIDVGADAKSSSKPGRENDYVVSLDGKLVTYHPSEPLHVEPGMHQLEARDNGHAVQREVAAIAGQVVNVSLREAAAPAPPADSAPAPAIVPSPALMTHEVPKSESSARVGVTLGLAGAGVAAIIVGAVVGASSSSTLDDVKAQTSCTNAACSSAQASIDDAHRSGVWSTVLYGTGAALLVGAGAVWWLMKPSTTSTGTRVTVSPGVGLARFTLQF